MSRRRSCAHGIPVLQDCLDCQSEASAALAAPGTMESNMALRALHKKLKRLEIPSSIGPVGAALATHLVVTGSDGRVYSVTHDGELLSVRCGSLLVLQGAGELAVGVVASFFARMGVK